MKELNSKNFSRRRLLAKAKEYEQDLAKYIQLQQEQMMLTRLCDEYMELIQEINNLINIKDV